MFSILFYLIVLSTNLVSSYVVRLTGNSDIIQGEVVQFKAELLKDDGSPVKDTKYLFEWSDNASPENAMEYVGESPSIWNMTYNTTYPALEVKVVVKGYKIPIFPWITIGSASKVFRIGSYMQGVLGVSQGNVTRTKFVSNAEPAVHKIILQQSHIDFLNKTTNFLRTFWFVDCIYYGHQNGLEFSYNFTKTDVVHHIEALLVATYILPTPNNHSLILNTTISNTTLLGTNVTTNNQTLSGNSSIINGTVDNHHIDKALLEWLENYNKSIGANASQFDYCINSSVIPMTRNYTYGFFRTNFTVKAPVKISPINGTNWLMDGEILNINVSCNGSSPYAFCVLLKSGLYNVTGNETCKDSSILRNCSFGIQRLFRKPSEYTLVIIISNAVSHVVKPIAVNIYKVKKHAQLSVIIVPVTFSLIATTLIIFGVAYYVQNKRKYTIEVADFDFANQTSNMEYKSFTERLRESISTSLLKPEDYHESEDSWPESASNSRKYGSME